MVVSAIRPSRLDRQMPYPLVSAKRSRTERKGIHAWHPYYAGYSEAFVQAGLEFLDCSANTLVLDPWGGSGTTGIVAARSHIPAICADINPVMAYFAAAKSPKVLDRGDAILSFFSETERLRAGEHPCPLHDIFGPGTAYQIRALLDSIPFNAELSNPEESEAILQGVLKGESLVDPIHAFCHAVAFVTLRELSGIRKAANPTWLTRANGRVEVERSHLQKSLRDHAISMLADLKAFYSNVTEPSATFAMRSDVRDLALQDASIDHIITSPPYLTRIDYAMSTAPELATFGDKDFVAMIRHQTMGAPVITRNERRQKKEWGELCNGILNSIRTHSTKAASSYYWKNITQYFMDLDAALSEIKRVLKPGGSALIVVQSSYFKEIEMPLGEIYVEMSRLAGFSAEIVFREPVRGHLAHVNTKSSVYKKNKVYHEDVVLITNGH